MTPATPTRPGTETVETETEQVILSRLKTFDEDKKRAVPWNEVLLRVTVKPTP